MADLAPEEPAATPTNPSDNVLLRVLKTRDFRLLWIGQGTSLLGDQFYLIALPWLVLQLTGDPLALGTVLALAGIPRAIFMLLGGAVSDRFSPRAVMLASDAIRLILTGLLAGLVLIGSVQLWMLYVLALAFGLVSGFFMPASSTILPQLIAVDDLQPANALTQGTAQLSVFLGPVVAGGLIALASRSSGEANPGLLGIGLALGIDTFTFAVSVITLWLIRARPRQTTAGGAAAVLASIREGVAYVGTNAMLQVALVLIAAVNLLFVGPLLVGVPVMAATRLAEGAAAFGIIMSGYGGGNLLGYVVSGALPAPKRMGLLLAAVIGIFGLGSIAYGYVTSTALAFLVSLLMGIGNGYVGIMLITWMQKSTPPAMLGRVMSLLLFANVALVPLSQALAGGLSKFSLSGMYVGAGALILLTAFWAARQPALENVQL
jgi:MFS family permease